MAEPEVDVSLIIPYFRRPAELRELLAGLAGLERDGLTLETLVVEDGSPVDDPAGLQRQYADLHLRFIRNSENRGPGYSRNRGAREARGRHLWFIDTDALVLHPGLLRSLLKALTGKRLAVGGQIERIGGEKYVMKAAMLPSLHFMHEKVPFREDYAATVPLLSTTNFFIARSTFADAGGFDTTLRMYEDGEFCLRLVEKIGGEFYQDAQTVMLHNLSANGRDAGFFDYFRDRRRYTRLRFQTRNILLRRYHPWRLLFLPFLEGVSVAMFLAGALSGRWQLSRLAAAKGGPRILAWLSDALALVSYALRGVGLFFIPRVRWQAVRGLAGQEVSAG